MTIVGKKTILAKSGGQTRKIAGLLASLAASRRQSGLKNALIFALVGDLGSGKTTFVQGFLKSIGIQKKITSPTFVIIKKFKIRSPKQIKNSKFKIQNYKDIYHIDCCRINNPKEILDLGFKEIIDNPQNVILIEWADKIRKILPRDAIWIEFGYGGKEGERIINIKRQITNNAQ